MVFLISSCSFVKKNAPLRTNNSKVAIRFYDVDDIGKVYIKNEKSIEKKILTIRTSEDSGWRDIDSYLLEGINHLKFEIFNGAYGGWSGKYEISINDEIVVREKINSEGKPNPVNDIAYSKYYEIIKSGNNFKMKIND